MVLFSYIFVEMALNVVYQNTRGLRTKLAEFKQNVYVSDPDVLCVTESWLKSTISDHELVDLNVYNIFRRDRESVVGAKLEGGGVFIAAKPVYSATLMTEYQSGAEDIWISIKLKDSKILLICCVYLPPGNEEAYVSFTSKLGSLSFGENHVLLVCGDFNFSSTQWLLDGSGNFLEPFNVVPRFSSLIDTFQFHNLMQFNNIFNSNGRLLDLILCSKFRVLEISHCLNPMVTEDTHHPCVEFFLDIEFPKPLEFNNNKYFNFKKADYETINQGIFYFSDTCYSYSSPKSLYIIPGVTGSWYTLPFFIIFKDAFLKLCTSYILGMVIF